MNNINGFWFHVYRTDVHKHQVQGHLPYTVHRHKYTNTRHTINVYVIHANIGMAHKMRIVLRRRHRLRHRHNAYEQQPTMRDSWYVRTQFIHPSLYALHSVSNTHRYTIQSIELNILKFAHSVHRRYHTDLMI